MTISLENVYGKSQSNQSIQGFLRIVSKHSYLILTYTYDLNRQIDEKFGKNYQNRVCN